MHKLIATNLLVAVSLCAVACYAQFNESQNTINPSSLHALRQISEGSEKFSLQLFKHLSNAVPADHDFIISPFSVWSLLILTAEGAGGRTYTELQQVLGLPSDLTYIREGYKNIQKAFKVNTSTIELALNQVLFTDKNRPIDNEFEEKLARVYEADQIPVNFHDQNDAYYAINDYVNERTHGKISKVVTYDDLKEAQMLLISAIFFKGQWMHPFNPTNTKEEPFYNELGNNIGTVNMMFQKGAFAYTSIASLDAHVLELPYGKEKRLSMIIILPRRGVALAKVIEKLEFIGITTISNELKRAQADYEEDEVDVYLPRIQNTADFALNGVLNQMGLWDIFDPNYANLNKISKHPVYLSRIIHKAKIEITEDGTVASAVTGGTFANKNTPPRFYANRPFAYLIIEKSTNILLFCGQVKNPKKF